MTVNAIISLSAPDSFTSAMQYYFYYEELLTSKLLTKKKLNSSKNILVTICSILLCFALGYTSPELSAFYILRAQFRNP